MSVEHTYCEDEAPVPGQQGNKAGSLNTEGAPDVLMLGAVCCPACKAVIRFLDKNNLNYCEYDMETNSIGASLYKEVNGRGVPILFIGEHRVRGFSEATVTRALQDTGLL